MVVRRSGWRAAPPRWSLPAAWLLLLSCCLSLAAAFLVPQASPPLSQSAPRARAASYDVRRWSATTEKEGEPAAAASPPPPPPPPPSGGKKKHLTMVEQLKFSPNRWRVNGEELEPGVGGIWPGDPNAKTYSVTIRDVKRGVNYTLDVPEDRYIYFAFEDAGIDLPLINKHRMCRNGCCTTCALKIREGKTKMEAALGLLRQMRQQNYSLSCCALPRSDIVADLQDEDEVYIKQWGESFESGGVVWGGFLPDDD